MKTREEKIRELENKRFFLAMKDNWTRKDFERDEELRRGNADRLDARIWWMGTGRNYRKRGLKSPLFFLINRGGRTGAPQAEKLYHIDLALVKM